MAVAAVGKSAQRRHTHRHRPRLLALNLKLAGLAPRRSRCAEGARQALVRTGEWPGHCYYFSAVAARTKAFRSVGILRTAVAEGCAGGEGGGSKVVGQRWRSRYQSTCNRKFSYPVIIEVELRGDRGW